MCSCEGSLQAVVLDNRAASLGIAHRPDIGHAQRVAALLTADVLEHKHRTKMSDLNKLKKRATLFLHNYMFVVSLWWLLLLGFSNTGGERVLQIKLEFSEAP